MSYGYEGPWYYIKYLTHAYAYATTEPRCIRQLVRSDSLAFFGPLGINAIIYMRHFVDASISISLVNSTSVKCIVLSIASDITHLMIRTIIHELNKVNIGFVLLVGFRLDEAREKKRKEKNLQRPSRAWDRIEIQWITNRRLNRRSLQTNLEDHISDTRSLKR
ncbi:hypothetical protein V1478_017219 [Vespula squamosa]|uniref:Uncharacterized protein n=1 Tax=Vespula squamosa TaxID=30214 RepID=A0ABD1ZXC6_VESSQ